MKKLIALAMTIVMLLSVCTFVSAEQPKHKIGVLCSADTHGWVGAVAYYAEQRCKELGVEYNITTASNIEEMTTNIDDQIMWGAEALVVCAQWPGLEDPIGEVVKKGIPVVNFDIDIAVDGLYKVTGNNYDMGALCAQAIVDQIGQTGTVVALMNPEAGSVNELRMQGFYDVMKKIAPDMVIKEYSALYNVEKSLAAMADILIAEDHIDAVFSQDDSTSLGAIQAIVDANRTDIKAMTGGGGAQAYFHNIADNQDIWLCTALYSPMMVMDAVNAAVDLLDGKAVEPVLTIPTAIVDRNNVNEYLDENTPYYD